MTGSTNLMAVNLQWIADFLHFVICGLQFGIGAT